MKIRSYQTLIDYLNEKSSVAFLFIGNDGKITESNKHVEQLFGMKLQGRHYKEIFNTIPEDKNLDDLVKQEYKLSRSFNPAPSVAETYNFSFFDSGDSILAIGESEHYERTDSNSDTTGIINDQKNKFIGIIAHDLQNPIGIIRGYSNLLLQDYSQEMSLKQIKMLKSIEKSSDFMHHLVYELLDYTAIETGKMKFEMQLNNLVDSIIQNIELNKMLGEKKGISTKFQQIDPVPLILYDKRKIDQVLNNLLSNAYKFSMPGTTVKVLLFVENDNAVVEVSDQGQGIPDDEHEKLFKPFGCTSVKSTAREESSGLGLAITKNIILGHKGKIWFESRVGVGSTFYFSLPINKQ